MDDDRHGRLLTLAFSSELTGFYTTLAVSGVGLGPHVSIDLALVVDVLPDPANAAKDLGVFNIAGALPYSLAPAVAPAPLAVSVSRRRPARRPARAPASRGR